MAHISKKVPSELELAKQMLPPACPRCSVNNWVNEALECRSCGNPGSPLLYDQWRALTEAVLAPYGGVNGHTLVFIDGNEAHCIIDRGGLPDPMIRYGDRRLTYRMFDAVRSHEVSGDDPFGF